MPRFKLAVILFLISLLSPAPKPTPPPTRAKRLDLQLYMLRNKYIVFVLGVSENLLLHRSLANRITHHNKYLEGEEFVLYFPLQKLYASNFKVEKVLSTSSGLEFFLTCKEIGLFARLEYTLGDEEHFLRKRLWLKKEGTPIFLQKVELVSYKLWREESYLKTFPGAGQPVYAKDFFFGIEYPLSRAKIFQDNISLSYQAGKRITEQWYSTPYAIVGVGEKKKLKEWFFKYLERARHRPAQPYLLYNTWYDLRNYRQEQLLNSLKILKAKLLDQYQIRLDAVVLDSTWDDPKSLWEMDKTRFPQGLAPVKEFAQKLGAQPGIWLSPRGGYSLRLWKRLVGNLGEGYEKNLFGYCLPARDYFTFFSERIQDFTTQGVGYFKIDNIGKRCFIPWHQHRPGRYSDEAYLDSMLEIMKQTHRQNPSVYFNLTRGTWLSPFWLLWADCIWLGGMDYGYAGEGSLREKLITYRDIRIYNAFREKAYQFPVNGIMTHGIIKARYQFSNPEPIEEFEHNLVMYLGRGVSMWELYISPEILTDQEWEILAKWIKWAKENWEILKNTEMVLGNPAKGEVYGYLHKNKIQALLVLRNPEKKPRSLNLSSKELGLGKIKKAYLEYPEKAELKINQNQLLLEIGGLGVMLIRLWI